MARIISFVTGQSELTDFWKLRNRHGACQNKGTRIDRDRRQEANRPSASLA